MQGKNDMDGLLIRSFKELALHHPIEKITIKEITDKAGVIRPTFYNHFQDKYELLERIINTELLEPIRPLLENQKVVFLIGEESAQYPSRCSGDRCGR